MATTAVGQVRDVPDVVAETPAARTGRIAIPSVLALATLVALLVFLRPPVPSDQLNYLNAAAIFPDVPDTPYAVHQYARIGLVIPMALGVKVFGYSQAAYYLVPILAAMALAVAVYAIGTLMFGRLVGVGAAVASVGNTAVFVDATSPLPDLLATSLFCWALVIALAIRSGRPGVTASARRRRFALLAIGALLGWSYLAREFIVFVWPLIPVVLYRRASLRDLLWIGAPIAAIALGEMVLDAAVFGDPLARLRAASQHGSGEIAEDLAETFQNMPRPWYLAQLGFALAAVREGLLLDAALVATIVGALVWPRRLGLLLVWIALLYVPLVLLGGVLNPEAPMLRLIKIRYWYPIFPAFLVGGVAVAWLVARSVAARLRLVDRWARALVVAVTLAVALAPVAIAQYGRMRDPANGATQLGQLRSWLATGGAGVQTLWADGRTVRVARVFANGPFGEQVWDGTLRVLASPDDLATPAAGEHVLVFSAGSVVCTRCRDATAAIYGSPASLPPSWTQVFGTSDGVLRVYAVR